MRGKICLVTGVTSGIGAATAAELAARGAVVLGVARSESPKPPGVELLAADLACLGSVRDLAAAVLARHDRIDVLVNNAGVAKFRRELTTDGFEVTFATNHLGPFLLTNLLRGPLVRAGGRVVTVSSSGHRQLKEIAWEGLADGIPFDPLRTYGTTKALNVLFTAELARRAAGVGVTANCADPGFVRTGLGREATGGFGVFLRLARVFQADPATGARTSVHLAASADVSSVTGCYFSKSKPVEPGVLVQDQAAAGRLWELSARLSGLSVGEGW